MGTGAGSKREVPADRTRISAGIIGCQGRHPPDAPHHSGGSTASSYSRLNRAISSAAGTILPTLPTPWPLPQISFQAFGLARSPEAAVPKLIFDAAGSGRLWGSMPAGHIAGFR